MLVRALGFRVDNRLVDRAHAERRAPRAGPRLQALHEGDGENHSSSWPLLISHETRTRRQQISPQVRAQNIGPAGSVRKGEAVPSRSETAKADLGPDG